MRIAVPLLVVSCAVLLSSASATAQNRLWVMFSDRGPDIAERIRVAELQRNNQWQKPVRIGKLAGPVRSRIATAEDLFPSDIYIDAVRKSGAVVHARSRWLNAVSITANALALEQLKLLPFVSSIQTVRRFRKPEITPAPLARTDAGLAATYGLDYGASLTQLEMLRIPTVHDIWIDGSDIVVGMLDNGFRWRVHEAFADTYVLGEYDVINGDSLTENDASDPPGQDGHGTVTFSTLGGFKEGELIGPAFNAAFLLAKTEVNGSENQIEEDYWVEGLEWLESRGVSVVSASLGYLDWDDGTAYSWLNGDLDGNTAITTRAAVQAARRGIVIVTAMGNEGSADGTIIAPADADTVISVGAVSSLNSVAGFSSSGPTSDFRIKPDILAPGVSVYCANRNGVATYERANGTSLATPIAAGVAALVRSARPELTPAQVRDALRNTADTRDTPNYRRGWGLIHAWDALLYHGMVISTNPKIFWTGSQSVIMAWVISRNEILTPVTLHYSANGQSGSVTMQLAEEYPGMGEGAGRYMGELPVLPVGTEVRYHISAGDTKETRTSPYGAPTRQYSFITGEQRTLGAGHLLPSSFALYQTYPNPFEPAVTGTATIRYDVPRPGARVHLVLHDALGRRVRTLVNGDKPAGQHSARIDGTGLATGIYYYSLSAGGTQLFRRMLVLQ